MKRRSFLQGAAATGALAGASMASWVATAAAKKSALGPLLDPWSGPHGGIPRFDRIKASQIKPAFAKGMKLLRAEVGAITANKATATFDNTVLPFEDAGRPFGRVSTFFGVYTSTMNDKTMQKIETEMSPLLSAFGDEIIQNDALFQRLKAVNDARATSNLNAEQQRMTEVYYNRFARQIDRIANQMETYIEEFSNILQRSVAMQSNTAPVTPSGH